MDTFLKSKEVKVKLIDLINYIQPLKVLNNMDIDVFDASYNSKSVKSGDVFVCLQGEHVDGHDFAQMAVDNGASAIVSQKDLSVSVPVLVVKDTSLEIARVSAFLNEFPTQKLNLIGVTGTNGKTTVTHLIQNIMEENGVKCGLIGTLGQRMSKSQDYSDAKHTTPQAPELQKTFSKMLENDITNVAMEVSSHSIVQHRVGECDFNGAVLTNLTQDHLDYHITMDNYFKAKAILFENLTEGTFAVINNDDEYASRFLSSFSDNVKVFTYGIKNNADIVAKNIKFSVSGSEFDCETPFGNYKFDLKMTGMFSIYNVLAALAAGLAQGIDISICKKALENTKSVAGRFEVVVSEPLSIVDYAHTPDGLENVLKAAREILPNGSDLICIFGCGGDRDATKRPKMGKIAEDLADKVVVTSDNPRSEDPQQIITDILTGIKSLNSDKVVVEIDRKKAIEHAMKIAKPSDVIVVAGKGHEDYQILNNETIHFDDREEVKLAFDKHRTQFVN